MRVVVAFPSLSDFGPQGQTHALAPYHLAGLARAMGHEVRVSNPELRAGFFEPGTAFRETEDADVLLVSANTFNWPVARIFTRNVRKTRPHLPVVLGGLHATTLPLHAFEESGATHLVRGDAEPVLGPLLEALAARSTQVRLPGVGTAWGGTLRLGDDPCANYDFASTPMPAYDLVPEGFYNFLPFETSRGCPNRCAFCSILDRSRWKAFSPEQVMQRLEEVHRHLGRYHLPGILTTDDCFTANPARCIDICRRVEAIPQRFRWHFEARVRDLLQPGVVEGLARLRIHRIQVGIECGYPEGLTRVGKRVTLEEIERCADLLSTHGLARCTLFSFIVGFPWEGVEECEKTLAFASRLQARHGGYCNIGSFLMLPGSQLWAEREAHGIQLDEAIFDRPDWIVDSDLQARIRPRFSAGAWKEMEARLRPGVA